MNGNGQIAYLRKFIDTRWIASFAALIYLLLISYISDLKPENLIIAAAYIFLIWFTSKSRRFILAFTIFVIFGISYDLMKNWPNYLFNTVDIGGIYHLEKAIFGIRIEDMVVIPNEYLAIKHNTFLDLLCGLIYLNWVPVPLAYAVYLYIKKRESYLDYGLAFLLVNFIGFAGYYIHPAAPPWYVDLHGFGLDTSVHGNAAGLARFDELIGVPVFSSIYTRNSNVFAAVPSLHCAYPVVMLYYGVKNNRKGLSSVSGILMVLFMIGIWFSAVYSGHHYIIDVILGVICAITGIFFYELILKKFPDFIRFRTAYLKLIVPNIQK